MGGCVLTNNARSIPDCHQALIFFCVLIDCSESTYIDMMQSLFSSRRSVSSMAPSAANSNSHSRLKEILSLLHEKRESLAACRSRLSLTSRQIQDICSALYSSSCHSQTESSSLLNLQANVTAIKIVSERNVAMSHVIHLSQLRSHHLVLYACLDSLDEVLQECGGDKCTDSFLWSELNSLHVTR